jgi:hypothetical protein
MDIVSMLMCERECRLTTKIEPRRNLDVNRETVSADRRWLQ